MGKCKFCGNSAGFLLSEHAACRFVHKLGVQEIPALIAAALTSNSEPTAIRKEVAQIAQRSHLKPWHLELLIVDGLRKMIEKATEDHIVSRNEEERIIAIGKAFDYNSANFTELGLQEKLVKGSMLRDIDEGKWNNRILISGTLPMIIPSHERILWVFQNVKYYEMKARRHYEGSYGGVSVRIAKGVYVRSGSSRGVSVTKHQLEHVDTGTLALTDYRSHFQGAVKGFRIDHKKLISVKAYTDGIEIMKDGANSKPQIFGVDDPTFAANVLLRLASGVSLEPSPESQNSAQAV